MVRSFIVISLIAALISCSPSRWLQLDTLNPAEFSFPDTGAIVILNAAYLPSAVNVNHNIMGSLPEKEQFIFDTLVLSNLFDGFFSVLNESPNKNMRDAAYYELRRNDTADFLRAFDTVDIWEICADLDADFLITLEYYGMDNELSHYFYDEWETYLLVDNIVLFRIYNKEGAVLNEYAMADSLFWSQVGLDKAIPELPDAARELFFNSGEKYGSWISPYWSGISRRYFMITEKGKEISLDKEHLYKLSAGDKRRKAYKACYNLAVLFESEDELAEALKWATSAYNLIHSDQARVYVKQLRRRIRSRQLIDNQSGLN